MKSGTKSTHKRLLISFTVIILCLVLVFPVFAGCGGGASYTFIELMRLVPADYAEGDSGFPLYITLIDHASVYQAEGIMLSDLEELLNDIEQGKISNIPLNIGQGSFITGYGRFALESKIRKGYVGYDITCIDAEIQFGYPPVEGVAAIGRFNPQDTSDALSNQAEWPSWAVTDYTTEEYRGITIHSWGDGLKVHIQTRIVPPHIDELGRAKPLAITDRYLFYAASVEAVKLMIDASNDDYSSMADLPEYAAVASGLTELQSYTALVGDGDITNRFVSKLEDETNPLSGTERAILIESMNSPLKKFLTFGSGSGQDEDGTYIALVLYHENSDDAVQNVSLLKQRIESVRRLGIGELWSEEIYDTDIKTEGNALLAKLYITSSASLWTYYWFYEHDNLLYHEE